MMKIDEILKTASERIGVEQADLQDFFAQGEQHTYEAEEWLFHESTPRKWAGLVLMVRWKSCAACTAPPSIWQCWLRAL